jgi:predicted RNA-binding protein associated with RNAse of E/G family
LQRVADDDELDDVVSREWITPAEAVRTREEARYVADLILDAAHPFTQAAWERFEQAIARSRPISATFWPSPNWPASTSGSNAC